jgi:hypothetical protein
MKILLFILAIFLVVPASAIGQESPRGRLLFFGVAYDEAPGPGLTIDNFNYAPDNFTSLFAAQSKTSYREVKAETLKGSRATRPAVGQLLRALQQAARKDDVVFLYWGTHGGSDRTGWSANLPGDGLVRGGEIKAELARVPCPVIVAISTCGSGGFAKSAAGAADLPPNVAAFCACQRRQSTNNELDVSLLEALAGFGDSDGDGVVTLGEAFDYVPKRYRKLLNDGDGADLQPVIERGAGIALDLPLTKVSESCVAAVSGGVWYGGLATPQPNGKSKVRFLGYDSTSKNGGFAFPDEVLPADHLDPVGGLPPLEVEQDGTWYAAVAVAPRNKGWMIHYVGYPASDDEVVPPKRIRFPFPNGHESLRAERAK